MMLIGAAGVAGLVETYRMGRGVERSGLDVAVLGLVVAGTAAAMLIQTQPQFPSFVLKVGMAALLANLGGLWGMTASAPGSALCALTFGEAMLPAMGVGIAAALGARLGLMLARAYRTQCGRRRPGALDVCGRVFGALIAASFLYIGGLP